jgi:Sugar (and other) transporter
MQWIPALFLMVGIPFVRERPRWLAKKDRFDEAIFNLAHITAHGNKEDPVVIAEWDEIATTLAAERVAAPGWRKLVYNNTWRRNFAVFTVQAWQQLSRANVMTYYIVYVSAMAGLERNINLISSGVQYALFIILSTATFFFVDKVGRRPLLICHFVVGGVLGSYGVPAPNGVGGNLNVITRVDRIPSHVEIAF